MRTYGQYCPIARGSEVFAERWTPIILRNVLQGCRTFSEIAAGAPGLSRALLTKRLHELELAGIITREAKPDGHGWFYDPTPAGREIQPVLAALGLWADRWMEVAPEHSAPGVVLWSWCNNYLDPATVPHRRTVVRFEWRESGRHRWSWLLIENGQAEICPFDPGFGDDLVVVIEDNLSFARWHLGLDSWRSVLRSEGVRMTGPPHLRRALPTWNRCPEVFAARRATRPPVGEPAQTVR
ncbi:MAG: winged helix-turn-helix transcriptional regulator [Nocardioidaceae bacterium]